MEILDSFAVDEKNLIYSVALEPGFLVDVKVCSDTGLTYVMENEDGFCVYDQALAGHTFPDYKFDEAAVIQLVSNAHSKTLADINSSFKIIDLELIGDLYHVGTLDISKINVMKFMVNDPNVLNYDGIWWNEELDISCYSAPRGVIFNNKLSSFDVVNTSKEPEKKSSLDDKILSAASRSISEVFDSNCNINSLEVER